MLLAHQEGQSIVGGGHVADFDVVRNTGLGDLLGPLHVDIVLGSGGHVDVDVLDAPALLTLDELNAELVSIGLAVHRILRAHLEDVVELFAGDAVRIMDVAVRAGKVCDLRAELGSLLHDAPADVAVAGDRQALALDRIILVLQDFLEIVHSAVAGRFRTDQGAAVAHALAGKDAVLPDALQAAVLAVQIADLTAADAHIARRHVAVGPDVAVEGRHEALAEAHDLGVGLAGGIKVGTALRAAHGQAGQRVLEGLLEAEELDDAFIDVLLEAKTTLVRADRAVELAAPAAVGMIIAILIHPADAEREHPLRLDHALEQVDLLILGMRVHDRGNRGQNLFHGLDEFRLVRVRRLDIIDDAGYICVHKQIPSSKCVSYQFSDAALIV